MSEEEYYEISSYPFGGGWGGSSYFRLKKPNSKNYFDKPLKNGTSIEILWPGGSTSIHTIRVEISSNTMYERDSGMNLTENKHYPFIALNFNGAVVKEVRLNEINGIKVRFL